MICFMFSGQPLTREATLPDDADFAGIARLAREHAGLDLPSFSWTGDCFSEQVSLQVYGVAMSLYRHRRLRSGGVTAGVMAEHSMGIYPALTACGSISEGDALELAFRGGECMERRFRGRSFALGCLTGLREGPVSAIAAAHGVYLANYNTSRHFLLAGPRPGIEAACAEAAASGAFSANSFPVDAPLHTPLMEEIAAELQEIFGDYRYREPACRLVGHIDQEHLRAARFPAFLIDELCRPVYWEKTYAALRSQGVTMCYELGAGKALTKFNRWIDSDT